MMFIELSKRDVTKGGESPGMLCGGFEPPSSTFRAARIVLAGSKFVLDHGVADHQLEILWNFDEFVLRRAAIQQKRMCRAPKQEINWSMIPTRAPTNSFSAFWHS